MSDSENNNWPPPGPGDSPEVPAAPRAQAWSDPAVPASPLEPAAPAEFAPHPGPVLPEDLRAPWGGLDLFLFLVFILLGSVATMLIVQIGAMVWLGISPWDISRSENMKGTVLIVSQALLSVAMMVFMWAVVRLRRGGPFWRTVGWREFHIGQMTRPAAVSACLFGGVTLAVMVQLLSALAGKRGHLPIEEMFRNRQTILLLMALGILVAPLVEETMFRGFIYPVLARRFGIAAGIVITGILFGLMHAAQLWGGWGQIILLMIVGVIFTYVRARTGTVWASFLFHLGYNGILFLGFFIFTSGLRHIPGS